jgi:hypothetical protein
MGNPREITIIKADGEAEAWDPSKLERSLRAAGAEPELVRDVVRHIERDLRDGMSTWDIYRHAYALLKRLHRPIAAQYSLKKAILELGPSGYPFERFVAEILRREGYRVKVGVMVRGICVTHEVDVLAEKDDERVLVEAKYHNNAGLKTDVKVALYVDARMKDIKARYEQEDGAELEKLQRGWLITNTNFTAQAIQYGKCAGLYMTGWNYPKGRTFQDLVQATHAHPITCLTNLNASDKRRLIESGKVMCQDLLTDLSDLRALGFSRGKLAALAEESVALCSVPNAVSTLSQAKR